MSKVVHSRTPPRTTPSRSITRDGVKLIAQVELTQSGVYAVAFQPDGKRVAAAGADGVVRLIDAETGKLVKEFSPAPPSAAGSGRRRAGRHAPSRRTPIAAETLPAGADVAALDVQPAAIALDGRFDYAQLVVTASSSRASRRRDPAGRSRAHGGAVEVAAAAWSGRSPTARRRSPFSWPGKSATSRRRRQRA